MHEHEPCGQSISLVEMVITSGGVDQSQPRTQLLYILSAHAIFRCEVNLTIKMKFSTFFCVAKHSRFDSIQTKPLKTNNRNGKEI